MTKQYILKTTIAEIKAWIEFYNENYDGDSIIRKTECYKKCTTLTGLLVSLKILNVDKWELIDKIISEIIYGY